MKLVLGGIVVLLAGVGLYVLSGQDAPVDNNTQVSESLSNVEAVVYKSPSCGCCTGHAEAMEEAGIAVEIVETNNLVDIKDQYGIEIQNQSCHTTVMTRGDEVYVVEGHVPIAGIEALWQQEPDTIGIALPGMPVGTPGMPGVQTAPYEVSYIDREGELFISL